MDLVWFALVLEFGFEVKHIEGKSGGSSDGNGYWTRPGSVDPHPFSRI